jgi:hypothetical protein
MKARTVAAEGAGGRGGGRGSGPRPACAGPTSVSSATHDAASGARPGRTMARRILRSHAHAV